MRVRSTQIGWLLLAILFVSNLGMILLNLQLFSASGTKGLFAAWNLALLVLVIMAYIICSRADKAGRRADIESEKLRLKVADTTPETEVLEMLSDISHQFLEQVQVMPLLERFSEAARSVLQVDVCAIQVFGEANEEFTTLVNGAEEITFGEQVYKQVKDQASSVLINDIRHHAKYVEMTEQNLLGMVIAPFEIRGHVIGMIGIFSRQEGSFSGRELHLLQVFARHAALLIEANQLMSAVRKLSLRSDSSEVANLQHLRERLSEEREAADYEMGIARNIQVDLLPEELPQIPNAKVEVYNLPAKVVGGDFYDVIELGDDKYGLAIGDVSGKGVPAALVTVMSQAVLHLMAAPDASPSTVLQRLNEMLYRETPSGVFVSMFYGIWDRKNNILKFCNAGHEHPLRFNRTTNACLPVDCAGVALGAVENVAPFLTDEEVQLESGDVILLYTDGVVEAKNRENDMFGMARLQKDVVEIAAQTQNGYLKALVADIEEFVSGAEQHDDITMLSLCVGAAESV